jgi:hypothetical protein
MLGSVATAECVRQRVPDTRRSRGKDFELLGQGWMRIEWISRLSLARHVEHFYALQDDRG